MFHNVPQKLLILRDQLHYLNFYASAIYGPTYTTLARSGGGMKAVEYLNRPLYRDLLPLSAGYHQLALHVGFAMRFC